jgi:uncharacterized membrane protein YqiK
MPAWISISAAIRIVNPHLVTITSRDHVSDAVISIRDTLLRILSQTVASQARSERQNLSELLFTGCNTELQKAGLTLSDFNITEVSAAAADHRATPQGVQ